MSRQELAESVAAWVWEQHRELPGVDARYIGKLERGAIWWPNERYRAALREIFGVAADAELGFAPVAGRRAPAVLGDVDRRRLIQGTAILGGVAATAPSLAVSVLREALSGDHAPSRVSADEVDVVRDTAAAVSALSFSHGGALAVRVGEGQLRWATHLLGAPCREEVRPQLHCAVSRLADACGFAAFDNHEFDRARRMFEAAYLCAEEGGDWALRSSALADMALLALWTGNADEALTCTQLGLVREERLTPTERAMVWATHARAHAQLANTQAAWRAIGTADDHFSRVSAGEHTPLTYYTAAEHASTCANALTDLTMATGADPAEAIVRHRFAAEGFSDHYARSKVHTQAQLAVVVMATGDPDEAAEIGREAVTAAEPVQSKRSSRYFETLATATAAYRGRPAVDELREQLVSFRSAA